MKYGTISRKPKHIYYLFSKKLVGFSETTRETFVIIIKII